MVENEEGLINYIIEKEIDNVINDFENKSAQHTIDAGGYAPGTTAEGGDNWTVDEGEWTVSNKAREIKRDMNQIQNQIQQRTYAAGTGPGGDSGVVKDGQDIVTDGNGNGGYAPGTTGDSPGNTVAGDGGDNVVVTDDATVDSGPIDSDVGSSNDVAGVDEDENPSEDGTVGDVDED